MATLMSTYNQQAIISIHRRKMGVTLFVCLLVVAAASNAATVPEQIHPLRPNSRVAGHRIPGLDCLSWRLAVETNNIRDWTLVPKACVGYVGHYMLGKQYRRDCDAVADVAIKYAKSLKIPRDGRSIWVFDIDETSLSNLPYYARSDVAFGATKYNDTKFSEWLNEARAPAIPATLRLYKTLLSLGIKVVFLTGTAETFQKVRVINLKKAGYHTWEKLILKPVSAQHTSSLIYKSNNRDELVAAGYRIVGNIGDQWSDILGTNVGQRTFKLPDPMYYIG